MRTVFIALLVLIVLGGGWYWYSMQTPVDVNMEMNDPFGETQDSNQNANQNTSTNTNTGTNTGGTQINVDGSVSTGATKEFTVTNTGMSFDQKTLTVQKGDTVKVTFKNTGGTHDWVVDEFPGARTKVIQAGQEETVTFVADKAGSFEYYCSVGQHRQAGMWGTLTVTE